MNTPDPFELITKLLADDNGTTELRARRDVGVPLPWIIEMRGPFGRLVSGRGDTLQDAFKQFAKNLENHRG